MPFYPEPLTVLHAFDNEIVLTRHPYDVPAVVQSCTCSWRGFVLNTMSSGNKVFFEDERLFDHPTNAYSTMPSRVDLLVCFALCPDLKTDIKP